MTNERGTGSAEKYLHISVDDTIELFQNLTANAGIYTSLFQNPTLAFAKSLHDRYGAAISFYCFYSGDDGFDLSKCTAKFAGEFRDNAGWLRFGFHAHDGSMNYASATATQAKQDYDGMVAQLYRICGGYKSIDRVVRLANFAGNLVSCIAMRDTKCGVQGLLTADDTRRSYYLSANHNEYLFHHDRMYDEANSLYFFTTDLRMEKIADMSVQLALLSTPEWADKAAELIVFTHERELNEVTNKTKLRQCCQYGLDNNYRFDFPRIK